MSESLPYHEVSPWIESPPDRRPALAERRRADVVVVGGGYTGLSAALSLSSEGADVVLLEQGFAGAGASGRNAGHLTPTIGKDLPTLLGFFGRERAAALVRFAEAAVEATEETIEKHGIDCEYEASGNLMAAVHPKQEPRLRSAADAARALGADVAFLTGAELRERGIPPAFTSGVLEACGGTLHPGRYVSGLRRAALGAGARIFEDSRALELRDGPSVTVRTDGGEVTADCAILATNAYPVDFLQRRRLAAPLRVSLFETQPLDSAQRSSIDWRGREGVYTAHEVLESYRLTARGTIVGGSKRVRIGFGSKLPPGRDPGAFRLIERAFRERFPTLELLPIAAFWGGWIGFAVDSLPIVGTGGRHENVHYGIAYAGHGVAQATLMGAILADRGHGREHPHEGALRRRVLRWPPEPLRWISGQLVNGALNRLDARTDRQIRRAAR